ncbi:MAG: MATE family efflux transporter [Verrucomicrobia bacterium]|nr:MATE family efflux transporter [Verrucomicrobiota bacterium]
MRSWMQAQWDGEGGMRVLLAIALPMIVSSAAETIMMFVDRLFLSRIGPVHLAASLGGGFTAFMVMTFFLGMIGYVNALVAQNLGANQKARCSLAGAQGIILALLSYPVILMTIPLVARGLSAMGHSPEQLALETTYFRIVAGGSVFGLLRTALSGFFCGIGKTRMVMIANTLAMAINVPANYALIFGRFGCPAMGIKGAAIATVIGSGAGCVMLLVAYWAPRTRVEYGTAATLRWDGAMMRQLLRFGFPSGVEFFMNMAAFNAFVLSFHSYGEAAAAAITITLNWDLLAFLPLIGLGQAVTSMTGRYLGAEQPAIVRRAALSGLKICGLYAVLMSALFVCLPEPLVNLFARDADAYAGAIPLAIQTLRLAAIYTIADGVLVVFDGALRGVGDTHWTMRTTVSLHWIMAIVSVLMIRVWQLAPVWAWTAFITFVLTLACLLAWRFLSGRWRGLDVLTVPGPAAVMTDVAAITESNMP